MKKKPIHITKVKKGSAGRISNPVVGYITFTAVKLVGYSVAGLFLNNRYANSSSNFGLVGLVRTVIGIVFGGLLGLTASVFSDGGVGFYVYFFGLIPKFYYFFLK